MTVIQQRQHLSIFIASEFLNCLPFQKNVVAVISYRMLPCRLDTSDDLLSSIQEKIKWADTMAEVDKKHRKEIEERVEAVKKTFKVS